MLTCRDVVNGLMGFLEGELDHLRRERFRAHLDGCSACRAYLASYRDGIVLARGAYADVAARPLLPERTVRSIARKARESRTELWNLLAAVAASPLLFFYFGGR